MIRKEEYIKAGRLGKPHGVKGEITLITDKDLFPDTWDDPYIVCELDGICIPFFIESCRYKTASTLLLKLEALDTEAAVRRLINLDVYCPPEGIAEDHAGHLSWNDFIGYTLSDAQAGPIGEITGIDESTANVLFIVHHNGKEILVPAADELIAGVDDARRTITVRLPEGLLELYV